MYDDGDQLWFGTFGGGLNGYNKKSKTWQYITEKDGLSNNSVYGILPENDSIFWVSTNMGLSRVNHKAGRCRNNYFEDGLQDNSFDEKSSLKIGRRLFFGGINGFTMVDLDAYRAESPTVPVYINRVEYLDKDKRIVINDLNWAKLIMPAGTHSIVVHLSALSYPASRKIKFSYRLKGLQEQYLDVPADNRIVLNAINYGDYELQIRYLNEGGVFVQDKLKLLFYIRPSWYQTWWFKALLVLLACGIAYAYYRMRIDQILKQHRIRQDVASDLHDDIGSSLNSVKVFAHLAMTDPGRPEYIRNVEENLEHATIGLRDMIWILEDKLDTVDDLRHRLSLLSARPAEAIGIAVQFEVDETLRQRILSKPVKRNLFLIAKEGINNSVKYAGCSNIRLSFRLRNRKMVLVIRDDGKGFDTAANGGGYGLGNMQHRAEQIHFDCLIRSDAGGTEIILSEK
jgi:signal transduction histidine kinase